MLIMDRYAGVPAAAPGNPPPPSTTVYIPDDSFDFCFMFLLLTPSSQPHLIQEQHPALLQLLQLLVQLGGAT
jgi:hypothetical protein